MKKIFPIVSRLIKFSHYDISERRKPTLTYILFVNLWTMGKGWYSIWNMIFTITYILTLNSHQTSNTLHCFKKNISRPSKPQLLASLQTYLNCEESMHTTTVKLVFYFILMLWIYHYSSMGERVLSISERDHLLFPLNKPVKNFFFNRHKKYHNTVFLCETT